MNQDFVAMTQVQHVLRLRMVATTFHTRLGVRATSECKCSTMLFSAYSNKING